MRRLLGPRQWTSKGWVARTTHTLKRSLSLTLPEKLEVGRRATVGVEGFAFAGDQLSMFVDPEGKECPSSASGQPSRAISLVDEVLAEGDFRVTEAYKPRGAGDRTFCAYLEASADDAGLTANQVRSATARRLRAQAARKAVVTALKRHGFARRVVKSLKVDCRRSSRSVFTCRFSARLPGYKLKGRGRVRLGVKLSYGFRVTAQGVRFNLTDRNEA